MVDFGSGHVSGVAPWAKTEGLSNFETAGIARYSEDFKKAPVGHSLGEA